MEVSQAQQKIENSFSYHNKLKISILTPDNVPFLLCLEHGQPPPSFGVAVSRGVPEVFVVGESLVVLVHVGVVAPSLREQAVVAALAS